MNSKLQRQIPYVRERFFVMSKKMYEEQTRRELKQVQVKIMNNQGKSEGNHPNDSNVPNMSDISKDQVSDQSAEEERTDIDGDTLNFKGENLLENSNNAESISYDELSITSLFPEVKKTNVEATSDELIIGKPSHE